jgi:hypothetical protein
MVRLLRAEDTGSSGTDMSAAVGAQQAVDKVAADAQYRGDLIRAEYQPLLLSLSSGGDVAAVHAASLVLGVRQIFHQQPSIGLRLRVTLSARQWVPSGELLMATSRCQSMIAARCLLVLEG